MNDEILASMGDKLVTCPYDICHKVKETRLKIHISKAHAKEKYLNKNLYECFYNPRHVVPLSQRLEHLMGCKDKNAGLVVTNRQPAYKGFKNW
ncbi:hypothetical protein JTE90_008860 [Oedothorax gibbosus]|uniref:CHHC U11-48K-type domain-containing protein n=1 Tax=Oedothorax gibbosus TaxID=931172 RepID=A0AAV6TW03_9ARAC|nr:hypothetical protein JTE90_008860 [Oedothorax gibbosus]